MITKEQAKQIVLEQVMTKLKSCELYEGAEEFDSCYAFYYQNRKYVETGNPEYMAVGHGPVLVTKDKGEIFYTGSAFEVGYYVRSLEGCGDPDGDPTSIIELNGLNKLGNRTEIIKYLRKITALSMLKVNELVNKISAGHQVEIDVGDEMAAYMVTDELKALGIAARQIWTPPYEPDFSEDEDILPIEDVFGDECMCCGDTGVCKIIDDHLAILCDKPGCLEWWRKELSKQ